MPPGWLHESSLGALFSRRQFLSRCGLAAIGSAVVCARVPAAADLAREIGVTSGSLQRQMRPDATGRRFDLWEFPRVLRNELDMRVIDLSSATLGSRDLDHCERFRKASEAAGCVITNLKVNVANLPIEHPDPAVRRPAIEEYKHWIRAAAALGARWLRPYPAATTPDFNLLVDAFRELADFGAGHGITLLVENYKWIESEPDAIPRLIRALDQRIAASPDIGNWRDEVRYDGLAKAFPHAVTCDFKVTKLDEKDRHEAYDLKRCFDIGWQAGFQGPWCFEHTHPDGVALFRNLALLRDLLRSWMV